jgi:hypothetical protein
VTLVTQVTQAADAFGNHPENFYLFQDTTERHAAQTAFKAPQSMYELVSMSLYNTWLECMEEKA